MNTTIIALVGMCGSGKSIVSKMLEKHGYSGVYFGKITMEELARRDLDITPTNERTVREELRKQYGMAAFAILSLPKINKLIKNGNKIYIDGLYSWEELKILKQNFGDDIITIEIYTDKKTRYKRLSTRQFRPLSKEQAEERDYLEIENLNKGGPIAFSDYKCPNNGSTYEAETYITSIIKKIEKE